MKLKFKMAERDASMCCSRRSAAVFQQAVICALKVLLSMQIKLPVK